MTTSQISIREHYRSTPNKIALSDGVNSLTYRELWLAVRDVASKMLGSRKDRFFFYGGNELDAIVYSYAASQSGKELVLIPNFAPLPVSRVLARSVGAKTNARRLNGYICFDFEGGGTIALFTSGTTGNPKAVLQSDMLFDKKIGSLVRALGIDADSVVYTTAPTTAAPVPYLMSLAVGASVYFSSTVRPSTQEILDGFLAAEADTLSLTPSVLERIIDEIGLAKFTGLKRIMTSSMPFSDDLASKIKDSGLDIPVFDVYASTETGPMGFRDITHESEFNLFEYAVLADNSGDLVAPTPSPLNGRGYISRGQLRNFEYPLYVGDSGVVKGGKLLWVDRSESRIKISGFAVSIELLLTEVKNFGVKSPSVETRRSWKSDSLVLHVDSGTDVDGLRRFLSGRLPWYYVPREIYARGI